MSEDSRHLIDLDAAPFIPNGWTIAKDSEQLKIRANGMFEWDPDILRLHLSLNQLDGKRINGRALRAELADRPVLGAQLLDYLLAHPHLIPEEWKQVGAILFWGTVYRSSGGALIVRYLFWDGAHWSSHYDWLTNLLDGRYPALVLR